MEKISRVKPGEENRAALLTRCQEAPAAELRLLHNVLSKGEAIVRVLTPHVEATVAGGDLDETAVKKVNKLGSRLKAASEALRR